MNESLAASVSLASVLFLVACGGVSGGAAAVDPTAATAQASTLPCAPPGPAIEGRLRAGASVRNGPNGTPIALLLPPGAGRTTSGQTYPYGAGQLYCYGGPVQTAPEVYIDFWGDWNSGDPNGEASYLVGFFGALGGSGWANILTQYYGSDGVLITDPPTILKGTWNDSTPVPPNPSPADIQAAAVRAQTYFGDASLNADYIVALPIGVRPSDDFPAAYCAWHGWFQIGDSKRWATYINLPYLADPTINCGANRYRDGNLAVGASIVAGHEWAENATDPFTNGWVDLYGQQVADKCQWYQDGYNPAAGGYATQPLWSNATPVTQDQCVQSM